jgi:cytochrome c biogenesis protein CcmG, thiol:disulfide interchange protein DsbE
MMLKQGMVLTAACVLFAPVFALGKQPAVGEPAPDFAVIAFDGKRLTLADFKDQVLVINFWATWCTPCRKELPLLDQYFAAAEPFGFRVLAVTTEDSAPLNSLKPLAATVRFPMARSMRGPYRVMTGVPTNYVIDRHGILRYAKAGAFHLDTLNEIVLPLLKEQPAGEQSGETPSSSSVRTDPEGTPEADR